MARKAHAQWVTDPEKSVILFLISSIIVLKFSVFLQNYFGLIDDIPLIKTALDILELNYSYIDIIPLEVILLLISPTYILDVDICKYYELSTLYRIGETDDRQKTRTSILY